MPGGRRLGAAELQLVILRLLADGPRHGYELIRALEERSGGFYSPSPGVIYPALTFLAEIGHADAVPEGNRKSYTITESGRDHLAAHREEADTILQTLERIGSRMDQVREAFAGLHDTDPAADPALAAAMHRARHELKRALGTRRGCSAEEARRLIGILERATAEILRTAPKDGAA
ncbi:PadR family transcriptional regulator [Acetobacteraceae bacterium KSS12]|uniref:PadR family transcriptional regulator n=2 Tax=Rhizosaccharibacter radicis TaxID=2782605 RepID=A0ABT1W129_9PROT|nr:PadR family transcriptional regulator [Acetobacteraceae bacterium KSS12]